MAGLQVLACMSSRTPVLGWRITTSLQRWGDCARLFHCKYCSRISYSTSLIQRLKVTASFLCQRRILLQRILHVLVKELVAGFASNVSNSILLCFAGIHGL